jgi:hypothetical protein
MPAVTASVTLRISEGLLRRVDEVRLTPEAARLVGVPSNLAVSRNAWLVWAVEQALGSSAGYPSNSPVGPTAPTPAPAEQPEDGRPKNVYRGPQVEAEMQRASREFRPYPKGGQK